MMTDTRLLEVRAHLERHMRLPAEMAGELISHTDDLTAENKALKLDLRWALARLGEQRNFKAGEL